MTELVARGERPFVLTRSAPDPPVGGADVIVADASDREAVGQVLKDARAVIYAAGGLLPAESEADPARDAELTLPPLLTVLELVRGRDTSLTYVSSGGTVYGEPEQLPVPETHPTNPISAYGVVKLAAEKFVALHAKRDALRARILRCANVYGEGQPADRGQGAVAAFVARLLSGRPITVYGDGSIVRDYVYVGDVVAAALALERQSESDLIVNVGSGHGHSLVELIALLERLTQRSFVVDRRPARGFDVSEIVLDIARLRELTGYEPTPLEEGLRRVLLAGSESQQVREQRTALR